MLFAEVCVFFFFFFGPSVSSAWKFECGKAVFRQHHWVSGTTVSLSNTRAVAPDAARKSSPVSADELSPLCPQLHLVTFCF